VTGFTVAAEVLELHRFMPTIVIRREKLIQQH
jgi:hypothetical protein